MDIVLSSSHQQRFTGALQTLLSPLAYSSTLEWCSAVNASLALLLDADRVAFSIPGGEPELVGSDACSECSRSEADPPSQSERRLALGDFAIELGAFNRASLLGSRISAQHDSGFYGDHIVVDEACDWLVLAAALPVRRGPARVACIVVHTDPAGGRTFGNSGLALTRLLVPAFRAGIITHCRRAEERHVLGGVIDRVSDGMLLCDADGNILHQSAALIALLSADPDGVVLRGRMQAVARSLTARQRPRDGERAPATDVVETLQTHHACYRARGTFAGDGALAATLRIVVVLEKMSLALPGEADVRERFGLTPREASVCLLLARGKTNEEVAATLCISRYTARRHTEKVLLKLRVKSRAEIAPTLLEPDSRSSLRAAI